MILFPFTTQCLNKRMAKPVDQNNSKSYVITDQYIIANTSMTVSRGNQQEIYLIFVQCSKR